MWPPVCSSTKFPGGAGTAGLGRTLRATELADFPRLCWRHRLPPPAQRPCLSNSQKGRREFTVRTSEGPLRILPSVLTNSLLLPQAQGCWGRRNEGVMVTQFQVFSNTHFTNLCSRSPSSFIIILPAVSLSCPGNERYHHPSSSHCLSGTGEVQV